MDLSKSPVRYFLVLLFAVAVWGVNQRNVDYVLGTAADEWLTNIPVRSAPGDYRNSLHLGFFNQLDTVADNAALYAHRHWGVSAVAMDKGQLFAQSTLILVGTYMMCSALGLGMSASALALLFVFSSTFTWMGRYLQLQVTYMPSHSGVAFGFGLVIFALFFQGRRVVPIILAGLLGIWHPSHAAVILLFMWSYMALHIRKEGGPVRVIMFGALQAATLVPTYIITLPQRAKLAPLPPEAAALWWKLMEARTTNVFPLNDGLVMIADVWLGIAAAFIIPLAAAKLGGGKRRLRSFDMAVWVVVWAAGLWAIQIAAAHFIHNMTLTRFALTRCTAYAVVLVCIFVARALDDLLDSHKLFSWLCIALAAVFAILLRLHVPFIVSVAAFYAWHLSGGGRKWSAIYIAGLAALALLLVSGALLHSTDTFHLIEGALLPVASRLVRITLILSMAASAGVIASLYVMLAVSENQHAPAESGAVDGNNNARAAAFAALTIATLAVNMALIGTDYPFDLRFIGHALKSDAAARLDLQAWAEKNTPKSSMFVLNPERFGGFEQTAHRPALATREDIPYPLYAVDLLGDVYNRLEILGVDPASPEFDARCGLARSLSEPRCRQMIFYDKLEAAYPHSVIAHLDKLMRDYPNARYLVVEKGKRVDKEFSRENPEVYSNAVYRVYELRRGGPK